MSATENFNRFDIVSGVVTGVWQQTIRPSSYALGTAWPGQAPGEALVTYADLKLSSGGRVSVELDGHWKNGDRVTGIYDQADEKGHVLYPVFRTGSMTDENAIQEARQRHQHYVRREEGLLKAGMAVDVSQKP